MNVSSEAIPQQVAPRDRNEWVTRQLFLDYYASESPEQDAYLSSHWAHYSRQFEVDVDADGRIRQLVGSGFGGMVARHFWERGFSYAGHLSYLAALADRRQLATLMRAARPVCRATGFYLSFDAFKQLCALALLQRYLPADASQRRLVVLMIGDGYGFLSAMIKTLYPRATLVLVDLGKTLLFQSVYCQRAHPRARHYGMSRSCSPDGETLSSYDFIYCPTEYLDSIRSLRYDVAVTIAAMQEMNMATIRRYFTFLRDCLQPHHLFYCCSRESKVLRGGEVVEFHQYPWAPSDQHLVDEVCPWYRYYYSFRATGPGPRLFGWRMPFVNYFDGVMRHRLSLLSTVREHSDPCGSLHE